MPLSWNEIRDRALRFSREFQNESSEDAEATVLDVRAQYPDAKLADLYGPLSMPPALVKAHQVLDRAVDASYVAAEKAAGRNPPKLGSDAERMTFLFTRYQQFTSLLPVAKPKRARRRPIQGVQ